LLPLVSSSGRIAMDPAAYCGMISPETAQELPQTPVFSDANTSLKLGEEPTKPGIYTRTEKPLRREIESFSLQQESVIMRAIVLAAGVGKRLTALHPNRPKCLLQFGGKTLLQRHIECLAALGISRLDLILGFQAYEVIQHLGVLRPQLPITWHINRDFEQGSVVSLYRAETALCSGEDVLVMDADVLYRPELLQRLVNSESPNCLLLDREFESGEEPVKICLHQGRVVDLRKRLSTVLEYDTVGESVGFFRFDAAMAAALATQCAYYIQSGLSNAPHEEAVRDLLLAAPERFGVEDVSGAPWIEIDFPEDVVRAEQMMRSLL
jgi:choline kinase